MNKIETEISSNIDRFKLVVDESNGTGEICRKYNFCDNGKSRNLIKKYIESLDLNTNHFGLKSHPKKKYKTINKECPNCQKLFETLENHPREKKSCSYKCANNFFKKEYTDERKKQISESLRKYYESNDGKQTIIDKNQNVLVKKECKFCGQLFRPKQNKIKYCSTSCTKKCPEYRKKLSASTKQRVLNGTHNGWNSRKIISYPEQFFMGVLINNNISYQHNKPVGKYFIDFAIVEKKIALEIDGKQHQYENRKKSDEIKDKFLTENGWKVYRISWKSINNELGKLYIKDEINKFLKVYNGHMT